MEHSCYLCNKIIKPGEKLSGDHVVPRLLIDRTEPKVKGFDYAGKIQTHETCNNRFGSEVYCRKALKIISKLLDPECVSTIVHKESPSSKLVILNSECFAEFTEKDLEFFKVRDVRNNSMSELSDPQFIRQGQKTDLRKTALFTSFAVLVKSAAALLIKRALKKTPSYWQVLAVPYYDETSEINFSQVLGEAKPFDKDVQIYINDLKGGVYQAVYVAYGVVLFLYFQTTDSEKYSNEIASKFPDSNCFIFKGQCINDLIGFNWKILKK